MTSSSSSLEQRNRRFVRTTLKIGYVAFVVAITLGALEVAVRFIGLGNPILYYNSAWGGMRPLPNQRVERFRGATVTVDTNGFRSAYPEKPGALQILYLGDSVIWGGSSVDDRALLTEVAADVLRNRSMDVYAMNAGVNSTGLLNQSENFLHTKHRVDVLVWLFPWGDVMRSYASVGYLWPARHKPQFALVEVIDYCIRTYWLEAFRDLSPPSTPFQPPKGSPGYEAFFDEVILERKERNIEALWAAIEEAKHRDIPVVVGITPRANGGRLEPLPNEAVQLLKELEARGVTIFDMFQVMAGATPKVERLFLDHVHLSTDGHYVIGNALGTVLTELIGRRKLADSRL